MEGKCLRAAVVFYSEINLRYVIFDCNLQSINGKKNIAYKTATPTYKKSAKILILEQLANIEGLQMNTTGSRIISLKNNRSKFPDKCVKHC